MRGNTIDAPYEKDQPFIEYAVNCSYKNIMTFPGDREERGRMKEGREQRGWESEEEERDESIKRRGE